MTQQPLFNVGDVPVFGDAILAPMAGYSDVPYRALCRAYGSAMHYTEFVPVESLLGKRVHERFRQRLDTQPGEHPMVFQIFGNNAQMLLDAALRIQEWGPDIIDINMGCATRKVSRRGAGVGMMPQPALIAETFKLLSHRLDVPVTGKIRLGWDATQENFWKSAVFWSKTGGADCHARPYQSAKVRRRGQLGRHRRTEAGGQRAGHWQRGCANARGHQPDEGPHWLRRGDDWPGRHWQSMDFCPSAA
ncbi:MAG: tRNA-dihydrouridine synthase family protein [Ardenticatenaceae bacterium]|nr:tRNA-dihydrouridine synthase family protein [Ardenticatenaceae bacterium]